MKRKPIVGETLYRLNIGNAARRCEQKLVPVQVVSVGRKFFKCAENANEDHRYAQSYHIGTWLEYVRNYGPDYQIYETEQEWADEKELNNLISELRNYFSGYGAPKATLEQLRAIKAILSKE